MQHLALPVIIFIFTVKCSTAAEFVEVKLQEIEELNATCERAPCYDKGEQYTKSGCNCGLICSQLGTCCLDSRYMYVPPPRIRPCCRNVGEKAFFLVDRCPERDDDMNAFKHLCEAEWDGENDIMRLVPVTSLYSHISYKNYFCFQCHESQGDYVFWDVKVTGDIRKMDVNEKMKSLSVQLVYDSFYKTWVAPVGIEDNWTPVNVEIEYPVSIHQIVKQCVANMIYRCSDSFGNREIIDKCDAYMYLTYIKRDNSTFVYKNPHCALCNFESLSNKTCEAPFVIQEHDYGKKPFSFTFLLDINRSDGDKVGKVQRCINDEVWDPFFKKCRTLTCALPGYFVEDGKCVPM